VPFESSGCVLMRSRKANAAWAGLMMNGGLQTLPQGSTYAAYATLNNDFMTGMWHGRGNFSDDHVVAQRRRYCDQSVAASDRGPLGPSLPEPTADEAAPD
jgi:hypothetical protein